MNALRLAFILLARDALMSLVASAGWPRWSWASRVVDQLEALADGLRERREARE